MACDIIYTEGPTSDIYNWAIDNLANWDQIIWELPEKGDFNSGNLNSSWVHLAYNEESNKKTKSVASEKESIHEYYRRPGITERRGVYTHGLTEKADNSIVFSNNTSDPFS